MNNSDFIRLSFSKIVLDENLTDFRPYRSEIIGESKEFTIPRPTGFAKKKNV